MKTHSAKSLSFAPLTIAVLTVSDTRDESNDQAGALLVSMLKSSDHRLHAKCIVKDDIYQLRAIVSEWVADPNVQVILTTGGTGFSARDNTPEALIPLFDKQIDGFGELFRQVSYRDIGTSTVQSRAFAGMANRTLIACMPGSPNACRTAWEDILKDQLDQRHRPCNFAEHISVDDPQLESESVNQLSSCPSRD